MLELLLQVFFWECLETISLLEDEEFTSRLRLLCAAVSGSDTVAPIFVLLVQTLNMLCLSDVCV